MKKILLMALSMPMMGCTLATGYMKEGDSWWISNVGYSDFELGNNKYKVSYTGSISDEPVTVMKYAYQRAKDLCKEKGFDGYTDSNATSSGITSGGGGIGNRTSATYTNTVYSMDVECKKK